MAFRICLFFAFILSLYHVNGAALAELLKSERSNLGFSWGNCGAGTDPIQFKTLKESPDPIKVPGNVTIGLGVLIQSVLPTDIHVSVTLEKKVSPFWIKVPCEHDVGSCNYGDICAKWTEVCPKYFEKYGIPCTCPIPANTYTIPDTIMDVTKKLPSQAKGEFQLTANIGGSSGRLGCLKLQFKLD